MPVNQSPQSEFDLREILFILFSHKWKILILGIIGLIAAACLYFLKQPLYQSAAKLLVHYVIDTQTIDQLDTQITSDRYMAAALNDEIEILTSFDLTKQVTESVLIDPKKLLPSAEEPLNDAQVNAVIHKGLQISVNKNSNIIFVSYVHADPEMPSVVLDVLINKYFEKHLKTHRSETASEILEQKIFNVKETLKMIEKTIAGLLVGISSLDDEKLALSARKQTVAEELVLVEAELAVQKVRVESVKALTDSQAEPTLTATDSLDSTEQLPDANTIEQFSQIVFKLNRLIEEKRTVSLVHKPQSNKIKIIQRQIDVTESEKSALTAQFPSIANSARQQYRGNRDEYGSSLLGVAGTNSDPRIDLARLAEIEARMRSLQKEQEQVDLEMKRVAQMALSIAPHQRKKEIIEIQLYNLEVAKAKADGDYFLSNQANNTGLPNITLVQAPSGAFPVLPGWLKKVSLALAFGGFACGIGLAVIIELFIDPSIKRPQEFESRLKLPLMLSIPHFKSTTQKNNRIALPEQQLAGLVSPWNIDHFMRPFADAMRDRLSYYFEVNQMTHKPKLIAVTGFSDGAGTSSIACSLAASFAEMRGTVLYVDLNVDSSLPIHDQESDSDKFPDALQPLHDDLELKQQHEDLLIARFRSNTIRTQARPFMAKQLVDLIKKIRSISDLDYVVFDMPPLSPTNPTGAIADFMDKVLMVVDAGKTNREAVKRAYQELAAKKADVSSILNKTRANVPAWLQG